MRIFLLILTILVISQAQVLGIDFGTQFWKASLISPGKNLVIVQNSRSQRKTINGIAIQQGVRYFEIDALYKRLKKPQTSYFYLNKLLRSLDFQNPLDEYEFVNGTYYITHGEDKISLEQLVGMILKNVKLHASVQAGTDIKDAVLAIPPSWGWKSRMALLNAANIASLSVLGLVNENSAAAINFAITRNDTDPINIGFFNLGSNNLQFSIMQFFGYNDETKGKNIESLRVLSHVVVEDVGGLQVDKAIADHLSQKFFQQHKLDPRKNKKGYTKLLHEASEAKQTLSANKQTQVYVEGIMEGIDLNLAISREIVQKLDVFLNLHNHLDQALEKAGISKSDLHSIELIGGASRIPLVSKIVKEHFDGIQVGSHINGDEAMAFGASLRAANLSIAFRVKQLHFYDGFEKDIKCVVSSGDKILEDKVLFTSDSQHGEKAVLQLNPQQNEIKIDLFYGEELIKTYSSQNITGWRNIYNETAYNFSSDPNIVLGFILSTTNIIDLKESYVNLTFNQTEVKTIDDWIEEEVKAEEPEKQADGTKEKSAEKTEQNTEQKNESKTQQKTEQKTQQKIQEKTEEGKEENKEAKPSESSSEKNSTTQQTTNGSTNSSQSTNQTKKSKPKTPKKKLVKVSKVVLQHKIQPVKHQIKTEQIFIKYARYNKFEIQEKQKILNKFETHEKYLKEKSKIRNDLESTLYRLKDSYEEPYLVKFSKESELQNLKKVVSQKLEWLDENAWTAEKDDFEKQYNEVFEAYRPMYNRSNEYSDRQEKYNETLQYLSFTYQKTLQLNQTHSWLEDKVLRHLKKINDTVKEIHDKLKKQYDQPLNEDPILYNHEMINLAQNLRDEYYLLKMIPRPKPAKKAKVQVQQQAKPEQTEQSVNESNEKSAEGEEEKQATEDAKETESKDSKEQTTQQEQIVNDQTDKPESEDL